MRLKKISLKNYRCFNEVTIDFEDHLTVIVAENGVGKTAILDAIAVALGPFVGGFDTGISKGFKHADARLDIRTGLHIKLEDANQRMESQYPISLDAVGIIDEQTECWSRELTGKKSQTTFGKAKIITEFAKKVQQLVRSGEQIKLPIIAYYGTGRLWKQTKASGKISTESQSRLYGYHDALSPDSTYKAFAKWFTEESIAEKINSLTKIKDDIAKYLEDKETNILPDTNDDRSTELEHVRKAIDQCLTVSGWKCLEYDPKWRELVVRQNLPTSESILWTVDNKQPDSYIQIKNNSQSLNSFIPVSRLSDGVKAMLSLTADIAYRCVQLNPHLTSPTEETNGIVLIDEIDLHLHPKWQQTVLSDLQKTFPSIQFIVTTHSPQVLSTVHRESIRLLGKDNAGHDVAVMPMAESYGEISSDVLQSIMFVNPQPPVEEIADLNRLTEWVDQGQYNTQEACSLFERMRSVFGETHPQLQKLARSIKRQNMLKS